MNNAIRNGATGALLDEYERAISDLKQLIRTIPDNRLTVITDHQTADENCRSVQTILSHVVHAGYGYATSIHNNKGHELTRPDKAFHNTVQAYLDDLDRMFAFTEHIFSNITDAELEQMDNALKKKSGWGQVYDMEQMMEHAIVHILRHRRQLENITRHTL
jgi:uncharacterized damage-inducible protein DinB